MRAITSERQPARVQLLAWLTLERLALGGILAMSSFAQLFRLQRDGYGNDYYAAAVRSMLLSWHNFFFASFDPGGFVSVDKPPLGFWVQAAFARAFGFSGTSLLLPQALATVGSVALLYVLVRRAFGTPAGLVAALVLALTPISVATGRNNTIDSLLVLLVLGAAWAVQRANESSKLRWLLLGAALVGLGFNIKMLQAYLVLPALGALYLSGTRARGWRLARHATLASTVLLVVSFAWVVAVDLTPTAGRPYVGSSTHNSELELALGYNGIQRLVGRSAGSGYKVAPIMRSTTRTSRQQVGELHCLLTMARRLLGTGGRSVGPDAELGNRGLLRLLNGQLGGQIGWLLPLALVALAVLLWRPSRRLPLDGQRQAVVLWGVWLLTIAGFFSVAGFFHRYYLVMLAPAVAALIGIGVATLWPRFRDRGRRGRLLSIGVALTAASQLYILQTYPTWERRLAPLLAVILLVSLVLAIPAASRRIPRQMRERLLAGALVLLLVAPAIWASYAVREPKAAVLVAAGPSAQPSETGQLDPQLVRFLVSHQGSARFIAATQVAAPAWTVILKTGKPVMTLGGFSGNDPILTLAQLQQRVADGDVRYVLFQTILPFPGLTGAQSLLLPSFGGAFGPRNVALGAWVRQSCQVVPPWEWQSARTSGSAVPVILYDCAGAQS